MDAADRQHAARRSNGKRGLEPGREPEKRRSGGDAAVAGTSKYEEGNTKRGECTDSGQEVRKGERESHDGDGREVGRGEREQRSVRRLRMDAD